MPSDQELNTTAAELARWQGKTDAHMNENSRRLDKINGSIEAIEDTTQAMAVEVATIKTKVAFWSAVGGLGGAGIVSVVVAIVSGSSG